MAAVSFDRGTLVGRDLEGAPGFVWDPRSGIHRAPAHLYAGLSDWAHQRGVPLVDEVAKGLGSLRWPVRAPSLRPYQADALRAWTSLGGRGIVVMPTGSGKTRVGLSAIARAGVATLVLCPTRALVAQWQGLLVPVYDGPVGIASDGVRDLQDITVMTFESGYRHLDRLGARFGLVIVDEVHHFGSGTRAEALECLPAPRRLGLTATAPAPGTPASVRLAELVGPVVFEIGVSNLVGKHLAPLTHVHLAVPLTKDERARYEAGWRPFARALRAHQRAFPASTWQDVVRSLASSAEGREVLRGHRDAEDVALFPAAKAEAVSRILDHHGLDRTLVFVARTADAYAIATRDLVPVITAETSATERAAWLGALEQGGVQAIVSARVLNEGIDLPDAGVAVLVAGKLGGRELVQRIGRVLRPREGKQATVYTLATHGTLDERRFAKSWRHLAHA